MVGLTPTHGEPKNGLEEINQLLYNQMRSQIQTHTDDSASDDTDSFEVIPAT